MICPFTCLLLIVFDSIAFAVDVVAFAAVAQLFSRNLVTCSELMWRNFTCMTQFISVTDGIYALRKAICAAPRLS